jgi:hypothetical protein
VILGEEQLHSDREISHTLRKWLAHTRTKRLWVGLEQPWENGCFEILDSNSSAGI